MRVVDMLDIKTKRKLQKLFDGMIKTIDEWEATQKKIWSKGNNNG